MEAPRNSTSAFGGGNKILLLQTIGVRSTNSTRYKFAMARVALAEIRALTLYKDSLTLSRRGRPVPQLSCIGSPCNLFTPDVVRCENLGGRGTDVDWKVRCPF